VVAHGHFVVAKAVGTITVVAPAAAGARYLDSGISQGRLSPFLPLILGGRLRELWRLHFSVQIHQVFLADYLAVA
jgi:hypothetical protein